jgi:hypothetical protein
MLKLLQNLEQQKKGSGRELFLKVVEASKFVVVSFPTKSVSGKAKNMENNYSNWFDAILAEHNVQSTKLTFKNEIVYICHKK